MTKTVYFIKAFSSQHHTIMQSAASDMMARDDLVALPTSNKYEALANDWWSEDH